jgi:ATP-dependent DNA ligase
MAFLPMPLSRKPVPFEHLEWVFELKYDGFVVQNGRCQLISGIGHSFNSCTDLRQSIASELAQDGQTVLDGNILRMERLTDRKFELRRPRSRIPDSSRFRFVDPVKRYGTVLFKRVCKLDLEGVVDKHSFGRYITERERTTWFKIRKPKYLQMGGREKLRERHSEPVPGWHSCDLACSEL